jgi:glycosyltransferase involved in cell wall biosynthesis
MRLAILNLTAGGLSGGYYKYLTNLIPRLAGHEDISSLLIAIPKGIKTDGWIEKYPSIEWLELKSKIWWFSAIGKKEKNIIINFKPDVIFIPTSRFWHIANVPTVNMLRNMEPFIPNFKGDSVREMLKKVVQRQITCKAINQADHTIAVSNYVKEYLVDSLNISEKKISMIYHGLNMKDALGGDVGPASIPKEWCQNFLLTCGSIRPSRGLEDVINALIELKSQNLNMHLVIAGQTTPGMKKYHDNLKNKIQLGGISNNICWTGNLNENEMNWCFRNCKFFVMTSRIEACPNIALEALSNGAISVVSDSLPLPEFFSDCAFYYTAGNKTSLAEALRKMLNLSKDEKNTMRKKSEKRSLIFSWDITAEKTIELLKSVKTQKKGWGG